MFGLADCNNFFVSCERTLNPSLEGRAVVVLSNNDGCVVARSNEAKRMGVKMGQPAFEIKDLLRSGQVTALSGNHLLYRELSVKVHDIFRRFAPRTLDYSVDEAFLDMDGIPMAQLPVIGQAICNACREELGLPVTIGFAPTKTLAKIVTESCKKRGRFVGVLPDADAISGFLYRIPIGDLWGIGRRLAKRLYQSGVHTAGDFAARDHLWVKAKLGVNGERSWLELHGTPCIELSHVERELQDSISESRTFPEDVEDFDYIKARISIYATDCARKLRRMHGACQEGGVFLSTNPFKTDIPHLTPSLSRRFAEPIDDTPSIVAHCLGLLDRIYISVPFKRAGVWLSGIVPESSRIPSLFQDTDPDLARTERSRRLMSAIDKINDSPGEPAVKLAGQIVAGAPGHNDGYSSSFQAPR